ncbi:MAG: hypothetical protein CM15mP58_19120 [Burkholderiaceae bacterium]|nr:MAG: hypothetical protein CM15mP58_19120 [Burkholderiaceae bacterium]
MGAPTVPDEHADPLETSMPFLSSFARTISFFFLGIVMLQSPGMC